MKNEQAIPDSLRRKNEIAQPVPAQAGGLRPELEITGFRLFTHFMENWKGLHRDEEKLRTLIQYFQQAEEHDIIWMVALCRGMKPVRRIPMKMLSRWCMDKTGIPGWLMEECRNHVGDQAETLALLLPNLPPLDLPSASLRDIITFLQNPAKIAEEEIKAFVLRQWEQMDAGERTLLNKIVTGTFKPGIPQNMTVKALAAVLQKEPAEIAFAMEGYWDPSALSLSTLFENAYGQSIFSRPYDFTPLHPLDNNPLRLGDAGQWIAEWSSEGTRAQLVKRKGMVFLWDKQHTLITEKIRECRIWEETLPEGLVLEGILRHPKGSSENSKKSSPAETGSAQSTVEAKFIVYDLLEYEGKDIREKPLTERKRLLDELFNENNFPRMTISEDITFSAWGALETCWQQSREKGRDGLVLKNRQEPYPGPGSSMGWWRWKPAPLTIDAVFLYAQRGDGRENGFATAFTFAVKDGDKLTGIAKTNAGLRDEEIRALEEFVKANTLEKFGPVRTVTPLLVFEIAFDGIMPSTRHKAGLVLQSPRVNRWKREQPANAISTLEDLKEILSKFGR